MAEGWLIDGENRWAWRFHRDDKSWVRAPHVFTDRGRVMPDGDAPLLKERRHLRKEDAEQMWTSLLAQGWKRTEPLWGTYAEP